MNIDLRGTFLPVTTPFDPVTGDVDVVAFRANLRAWFQHPVRGLLIAGSTGESVFLDDAELSLLMDAARDVVPEDRLIIVGTGAEATRAAIAKTKKAADAGADAVLVKPPAYFKGAMTPEVLARHYRAVADASPVPVIIYQVPLRLSTLEFPTGLVAELSKHPNIVGIKDSRGNLDLVGELVAQCAAGFQVLVGAGSILYGGLEIGAVGGIVAVGLMAPAEAAEVSVAFYDGRPADAGRLQERIAPVHTQIVGGMGVPGVKVALDLLGLRGGDPRPPLAPVPESRRDEIRGILETAGLLTVAPA
ncbi:MAG TPA: dihydrodipicolinate synthase family protein [Longimicrobiales bacterium]|nr:dihydrodipicolinate synthase family protein [Longimicrobiales bacterium]